MEERCRGWINDEGDEASGEICLFLMGLDQNPMRRFPEFPRQWRHRQTRAEWTNGASILAGITGMIGTSVSGLPRRGSGSLMKFNSQRVAFD